MRMRSASPVIAATASGSCGYSASSLLTSSVVLERGALITCVRVCVCVRTCVRACLRVRACMRACMRVHDNMRVRRRLHHLRLLLQVEHLPLDRGVHNIAVHAAECHTLLRREGGGGGGTAAAAAGA